jgi:uncharacterized protein YcfJ
LAKGATNAFVAATGLVAATSGSSGLGKGSERLLGSDRLAATAAAFLAGALKRLLDDNQQAATAAASKHNREWRQSDYHGTGGLGATFGGLLSDRKGHGRSRERQVAVTRV